MMSRSKIISDWIDGKIGDLTKKSSKQVIFKIHQTLRRENEEAYEPQMLSIGPYHHGKQNLQMMEKYKLKYLQEVLERRGESSVERYIVALMEVEEEARNYYDDEITLSFNDFVGMMLLDGFFIIEFLRKNLNIEEQIRKGDPNFSSWSRLILCRDLLLFENQLPFTILVKLFYMTKVPAGREEEEDDIIPLATSILNCLFVSTEFYPFKSSDYSNINLKNVHHLLGLMYESWCNSYDYSTIEVEEENPLPFEFSKSATELVVHGIKFRQSDTRIRSLFDITYKDGVIKIPPLVIGDLTESVLKNLIVYEEYMCGLGYAGKLVTDYAAFIERLIDTSNDVRKLRDKGIIKNWLGSDEEAAHMINNICKNTHLDSKAYTYRKIFKEVNEHCRKRRHRWIAFLGKNYFKNPWSIISVVAATILLLLTFIQTIFSAVK